MGEHRQLLYFVICQKILHFDIFNSVTIDIHRCPSVRGNGFPRCYQMNYRQIVGKGTYPPYLQTNFTFLKFFYDFFFVFFNMRHGRKNSNDISDSPLKVGSRFCPTNSSIPLLVAWVCSKLVQRIVKFQIVNFWHFLFLFFFFLVNMGPHGSMFQMTSPLKVHIRFSPQNSCILLRWISTNLVKRIVKFKIFGKFSGSSFGHLTW